MKEFDVKAVVILVSVIFLVVTVAPIKSQASGWIQKANAPDAGGYGEAVVGTGDHIYIVRCLYSSSTPYFWRYDPLIDGWVLMNTTGLPMGAFRNGAALAWDQNDLIYALMGARYSDSNRRLFYRYSISNDTWVQLVDTPHAQGAGDAITWSGYDGLIYAFLGSKEHGTAFASYNISNNTWITLPFNLNWTTTDDGASLVWTGNEYLYALRGEWQETAPCQDFSRYQSSTKTWQDMSSVPEYFGIGDGGSLLWADYQFDYIFALGGNDCLENPGYDFYRYIISSDRWEDLDHITCPVGNYVGNRLGFAGKHIYYWQGTPATWACNGNAFYMFDFPWPIGVIFNIGDIFTDPQNIKSGDGNVEIRVVIINEGDNAARNVEAILQLTDSFNTSWPESDYSYIGSLNSNASYQAIFHINIAENIEPGEYTLPLQISFKDIEGHDFKVTHEIRILVKPKPNFRITSYTEPEKIIIGNRDVVLHVSVENIGSENAESVSLWITNKTKEIFVFDESRIFLGNLALGEEVEAIFNFDVPDHILGDIYQIGIDIVCIGDRNVGDDDVYVFRRIINLGFFSIFETGSLNNPYPSISGIHIGTITPSCNISAREMYTYPCPGTSGHTEYVKIFNNTGWNATATWNGYDGDWHNVTFNNSFILDANETYNFTICTGSYPQIIHAQSYNATGGVITCTEFIDVNGNRHEGWIPAIRLY